MKPKIISDPRALFSTCEAARRERRRVGFVPTMGALHEGHLSLVELVKKHSDFSVVSIFVNPTQFGPTEDFNRYPRTFEKDLEKLSPMNIDAVFAPLPKDMYPDGFSTRVIVGGVSEGLCGDFRPNHFEGVAVIVAKLLCAVGACAAAFGRKDYQQLRVIKRMAEDLNLPVDILEGKTLREADGLAMSSRNAYLSTDARQRARAIPEGLTEAHLRLASGPCLVGDLQAAVSSRITPRADTVEYITAADPDTLCPLTPTDPAPDRLLIAVAARFGATRLIDNTVLGEDEPPIVRNPPIAPQFQR
jgi:pantoate--beta-alanine ligase